MNSLVRFACLGYKAFFFTNDDEFFIKTKITLFANVAMGFTFYNNLFNDAALLRPTLYERIQANRITELRKTNGLGWKHL